MKHFPWARQTGSRALRRLAEQSQLLLQTHQSEEKGAWGSLATVPPTGNMRSGEQEFLPDNGLQMPIFLPAQCFSKNVWIGSQHLKVGRFHIKSRFQASLWKWKIWPHRDMFLQSCDWLLLQGPAPPWDGMQALQLSILPAALRVLPLIGATHCFHPSTLDVLVWDSQSSS